MRRWGRDVVPVPVSLVALPENHHRSGSTRSSTFCSNASWNPERVSMPDFDVDFALENADRVIDRVAEMYGA